MFQGRRALILLLVGLGVVTSATFAYRQHKRYKHLAVHDEGMVYRSAWLNGDVFAEVIEEYQLRTIVNLCNPGEMGMDRCHDQRAAVAGAGAKLIEMSMPVTVDVADPSLKEFVQVLSNPDNYPMLVHCQHGVTRTAKLLVMYDVLYRGMTSEQSLAAMPLFGRKQYPVSVRAFAKEFEREHRRLYPEAVAGDLDKLRKIH